MATPLGEISPPDRKPTLCDELGKLTRLGSVLNYSDDQSSENNHADDDDDVHPASSVSEAPRSPSSSSPDPDRLSATMIHPEPASAAGLDHHATDLKDILASSASPSNAALAFQRWRVSSLKAVFAQELKKVLKEAKDDEARLLALEEEVEKKEKHLVHALADSAQLRAQLCALENVNEERHGTSDMEALQVDLVKALERASSSEGEVERYNKEIRKLRERLKAMEDEASRLDSELKSSISFLQKEKEGAVKENRILLEQLARKDQEVLSQTQEVNHLKSVLAFFRVSRGELERLKGELQGSAKEHMEYAKFEQKGMEALQHHTSFEPHLFKDTSAETEEASIQSRHVFSQLLDLLQKLTTCLQKNEATMGPSGVIVPATEEAPARSGMSGEEALQLHCEADEGKDDDDRAGHLPSFQKLVTKPPKKGPEGRTTARASSNRTLNNLSMVTCWKWRWVAASCQVQELAKELSTLRSFGKGLLDRAVAFPQPSPTTTTNNGLESFYSYFFKSGLLSSEEPPGPLTLDKVFTLLTSVCKISSQSAHQEREVLLKSKKFNHLLFVSSRWMQRATQKRQLERVLVHWLRYLLQSWKDKFKKSELTMCPVEETSPPAISKVRTSDLKGSNGRGRTALKSTGVDKSLNLTKIGSRKEGQEAATDKALKALQRLKADKGSRNQNGDVESITLSPASTGFAWKICCELEHCFSEARSQIMTFFGLLNKIPSSMHPPGVRITRRAEAIAHTTEKDENSKRMPQKRRPRIRTSARIFYV